MREPPGAQRANEARSRSAGIIWATQAAPHAISSLQFRPPRGGRKAESIDIDNPVGQQQLVAQGRHVLLEVNPAGQYMWIESKLGLTQPLVYFWRVPRPRPASHSL